MQYLNGKYAHQTFFIKHKKAMCTGLVTIIFKLEQYALYLFQPNI